MNTNILPPAARTKLAALADAAEAARALAANTTRRLNDLRAARGRDPVDAADLEEEVGRLSSVQGVQQQKERELAHLCAQIAQWLRTIPAHANIEPARALAAKPLRGETLLEAILRVRDEATAARRQIRAVSAAPVPRDDLKAQVRARVQELAAKGRPKLNIERNELRIAFRTRAASQPGMTPEDTAALLAWLHPAEMEKRLEAEVDALPVPELSMTATEKAARLLALATTIDELERQEEALIEAAAAQGQDVARRPNAAPMAVLGVVLKSKKAAAA